MSSGAARLPVAPVQPAAAAAGQQGAGSTEQQQEQQQQQPLLPVFDSVSDYEKLHRLGEGTYGVVYKARDRRTGEIVALKKVRWQPAVVGSSTTARLS